MLHSGFRILQVLLKTLDSTSIITLLGLKDLRQHICNFGVPSGRYRVEWIFNINKGYAFIRSVSYSSGICNYTG